MTSITFHKLVDRYFGGIEHSSKFLGVLYGLGTDGNNELLNHDN
jgi:hypothetical protein